LTITPSRFYRRDGVIFNPPYTVGALSAIAVGQILIIPTQKEQYKHGDPNPDPYVVFLKHCGYLQLYVFVLQVHYIVLPHIT
jgi:hypothetical protein